jgi:hypothetical protein
MEMRGWTPSTGTKASQHNNFSGKDCLSSRRMTTSFDIMFLNMQVDVLMMPAVECCNMVEHHNLQQVLCHIIIKD